ncbi:MAG: hypothetical protein ACPG6B_06345 [Oceanihabitans sp.]
MNLFKEHIIFKILTLVLVCFLLMPSIVKLAHVFENHKHEVCIDKQETHFHTLDLDCEFYKFKVNNNFTFNTHTINLFSIENNHKVYTSQYQFISSYQRLSFALRGPPQLI